MHLLFVLLAVPLLLLGAHLLTHIARQSGAYDGRVGLLMLMTPVMAAVIALTGLKDVIMQACALAAASWMALFAAGIVAFLAMTTVGALVGLGRLALVSHRLMRGVRPDDALERRVVRLAQTMNVRPARVFVTACDQPVAHVWGLWRPKLVISTWMLRNLDDAELDAVIAHELSHVKRHDVLTLGLTSVTRDAFFYLPASHVALRAIRRAIEASADEWAVRSTGNALGLASALAKVWKAAAAQPVAPAAAPTLAGNGDDATIESRILRLMAIADVNCNPPAVQQASTLSRTTQRLLLVLFAANLAVMALPNGCLPLLSICIR